MSTEGSNIFHIGLAVPHLETAMAELGEALSLTWRTPFRARATMADEHGTVHELDVHGTFSADGPPAIELIEAIPGSPLDQPGGQPFHHIGYWSDDVVAEKDRLGAAGWPCIAWSPRTATSRTAVIHRGPLGIGIEPCALTEDRPHLRDLFPPSSPFFGTPD